jgi:hypothetical protein
MTLIVGGLQIACTPEETTRIDAAALSDNQLLTLVRMSHLILPHDLLDVAVFRDAMTRLADSLANDTARRKAVIDGIAALDGTSLWLDIPQHDQLAALTAAADSDFFRLVETATLENIYRDERAWQFVGYEGEAIKFGGYIDRGFNDIDWLPTPTNPEEVN